MNFAKYRVQLSTEKKYSSKYKYEYEYSIPDTILSKPCRNWSDEAECGVRSGFALFAYALGTKKNARLIWVKS